MKKNKFLHAAIIMILTEILSSCTKSESNESIKLENTNWKLVGIVNLKTGILTELEPKDCENCYTFAFDTDTTAWGYTVSNEMFIGGLNPIIIGGTKIMEEGDANICYDALFSVRSYMANKKELKLFYDNNNKYLLYKLIEH